LAIATGHWLWLAAKSSSFVTTEEFVEILVIGDEVLAGRTRGKNGGKNAWPRRRCTINQLP
jgi:hypothetical protein